MASSSTRILASADAQNAITKMEATLNGGEWDSFITALTNEANTLTDSNNWDGPLALQFQNDTWPSVQSSLKSAQSQLNDLKSQLHTIAQNIFQAGGSN